MGSVAYIAHLDINPADYAHVSYWRSIWVDPSHQGAGLGAYLYATIDTEARNLGKEKLVIYMPYSLPSITWFTGTLAFTMEGGDVSTGAGYRDLTTTGGVAVPPLPNGYEMRSETYRAPPMFRDDANDPMEFLKNVDTTKYIISANGEDVAFAWVDY